MCFLRMGFEVDAVVGRGWLIGGKGGCDMAFSFVDASIEGEWS